MHTCLLFPRNQHSRPQCTIPPQGRVAWPVSWPRRSKSASLSELDWSSICPEASLTPGLIPLRRKSKSELWSVLIMYLCMISTSIINYCSLRDWLAFFFFFSFFFGGRCKNRERINATCYMTAQPEMIFHVKLLKENLKSGKRKKILV